MEPVAEMVAQLAQEIYNSEVLQALITRLGKVDFEVRLLLVPCNNALGWGESEWFGRKRVVWAKEYALR